MNIADLKILWTSWVAGPEVLFAVRIGTVVPLMIYAGMKMWEFGSPLHRHPLTPLREAGVWRWLALLTGIFAVFIASYFLFAGFIEQDRGGTPFRLIYANAGTGPFYWLLCLSTIKRRKESWERKYLAGEMI